jgi:hypothetical protein
VLLTGPFGGLTDDVRESCSAWPTRPSIVAALDPADWRQALAGPEPPASLAGASLN